MFGSQSAGHGSSIKIVGPKSSLLDEQAPFGSKAIKGRSIAGGPAGVMKQGSSYGSGLIENNQAGMDIGDEIEEFKE